VEQHALTALGVVTGLAILGILGWWMKKRRRSETF
jgi:LPXTG-motif cell wall-anchored protein